MKQNSIFHMLGVRNFFFLLLSPITFYMHSRKNVTDIFAKLREKKAKYFVFSNVSIYAWNLAAEKRLNKLFAVTLLQPLDIFILVWEILLASVDISFFFLLLHVGINSIFCCLRLSVLCVRKHFAMTYSFPCELKTNFNTVFIMYVYFFSSPTPTQ